MASDPQTGTHVHPIRKLERQPFELVMRPHWLGARNVISSKRNFATPAAGCWHGVRLSGVISGGSGSGFASLSTAVTSCAASAFLSSRRCHRFRTMLI